MSAPIRWLAGWWHRRPLDHMAELRETYVSLRFFGDTLEPQEITAILGIEPSRAYRKGDPWSADENRRYRRTGAWLYRVPRAEPGDLVRQLHDLLNASTANTDQWVRLTNRYHGDIFCGLFMAETNEGVEISPLLLEAIASRGLRLSLDVYAP